VELTSAESNAEELVTSFGFPFEEHFVETKDGFILGLHVRLSIH